MNAHINVPGAGREIIGSSLGSASHGHLLPQHRLVLTAVAQLWQTGSGP